jgi:RNA polymerase sigma factor (sigma-70 family)
MSTDPSMEPEAALVISPADSEDVELVSALRAGDSGAPALLLERYQAIVLSLCLRMLGHRQDAEDVVQETFLRALRGVGGFDGRRPLRPWLLGIAANRCRTALSKRKRRPPVVESVLEPADTRAGLADPDDLGSELDRALATLRPDYKLVFSMYHEQGLAYEDIAIAMARPVGTIKTWLHRTRAELAFILAERGFDPNETEGNSGKR